MRKKAYSKDPKQSIDARITTYRGRTERTSRSSPPICVLPVSCLFFGMEPPLERRIITWHNSSPRLDAGQITYYGFVVSGSVAYIKDDFFLFIFLPSTLVFTSPLCCPRFVCL
ncbi:hypothetical protein SUGI_1148980 [Cryptomeria japonica]|nr:hypothetical protein SUGI_1148980 [Cryptomeria japonica]